MICDKKMFVSNSLKSYPRSSHEENEGGWINNGKEEGARCGIDERGAVWNDGVSGDEF